MTEELKKLYFMMMAVRDDVPEETKKYAKEELEKIKAEKE